MQAQKNTDQRIQAQLGCNQTTRNRLHSVPKTVRAYLRNSLSDWQEFVRHPIFLSSISISCLYFTVLGFDGIMISYLKSVSYTDPFIAGMRGLNVLTGLMGTIAMPFLEGKLGLVRAGNWSIW